MPITYGIEHLPVINVEERAFDCGVAKPDIPQYITENLKHPLFEWQNTALTKLLTFQAVQEKKEETGPVHLMFNMATGSGKTLLMAAAILQYYRQGYKHFLFFVNRKNIVDKTENNFIDGAHAKYLFREKIVIDDKTINISKVETFSDDPQGIEIKFTSIQKLYNDIHIQRENRATLEELNSKDIVMLADEAHHLNANTQQRQPQMENFHAEINNRTGQSEVERKGWEHTVIELILKKNGAPGKNKNVLLEFTATVPETHNAIAKYDGKVIYKLALKTFLRKGYTKEINLISSTLEKKERILQALLFSWYRHQIALKHGVANFKPVTLFRSRTIEESKADHQEFLNWMGGLAGEDFDFLKTISAELKDKNAYEQAQSRTEQVLKFIKSNKVSHGKIAQWIKDNYQEKNVIITNSKTNAAARAEKTDEETEKLLNNLEDKNNHIRAIFTVERLTEGWDVLNLFDIVRLYKNLTEGINATIKEKQLIGRGVRYCPFAYQDKPANRRKFDNDTRHELRALEELYYYTYDEESRYIWHLKAELKRDGYIVDDKKMKAFALKEEFVKGDFYKKAKVWYNKPKDNPAKKKKNLDGLQKDFFVPYKIKGLELSEEEVDFNSQDDLQRLAVREANKTIAIKFKDIEKHIFLKAVNIKAKQEGSLFQFERLKEALAIDGIDDLQTDKLADFDVKIIVGGGVSSYDDIDNEDKLGLTMRFLDRVFAELKASIAPKIGGDFIAGEFKKIFGDPKMKMVAENEEAARIAESLKNQRWYVLDSFHGTKEEIDFINYIQATLGNLREACKEFYLLRNEEVYKIYDFDKARGFQPDFLLFVKTKSNAELCYQLFIEVKGSLFLGGDGAFESGKEAWKEKFLREISERYGYDKVITIENPKYRLIGLPFFNSNNKREFEDGYNLLLQKLAEQNSGQSK